MGNKVEFSDKSIYYKYDPFWLYQLIYYGNERTCDYNGFAPEIVELCNPLFITQVDKCTKESLNEEIIQVEK